MATSDPQRIDQYLVEERLGKGSMGVLYKAKDPETRMPVAIKVLADELLSNARAVERFKREIRSSIQLEHPNLVQALAAGQFEGKYYYVMEFVEGTTVKKELRAQGRFQLKRALQVVTHISRALEYAGQFGLVHRDIKPDNILLSLAGTAKLADMGLAKSISSQNKLTLMGSVLGTPHYMSPEQAKGEEIDPRADIYSLGATFYHMLAGRPPFDGTDPVSVITRLLSGEPTPLKEVDPGVPDRVCYVIEKMMARDRENRYGDAKELLVDLASLEKNQAPAAERQATMRIQNPTPAREWSFRFCHVPSRFDILFARIVLASGGLDTGKVEEALDRQERLAAAGIELPLGEVLLEMGHLTAPQKGKVDSALVQHAFQTGLESYARAVAKSELVSVQRMAEYRRKQQLSGKSLGEVIVEAGDLSEEQKRAIRRIQLQAMYAEEDRFFLKAAVGTKFLTPGQAEKARVIQNNKALQGDVEDVGGTLVEKKTLSEEHRRAILRAVRRSQVLSRSVEDLISEERIDEASETMLLERDTDVE